MTIGSMDKKRWTFHFPFALVVIYLPYISLTYHGPRDYIREGWWFIFEYGKWTRRGHSEKSYIDAVLSSEMIVF